MSQWERDPRALLELAAGAAPDLRRSLEEKLLLKAQLALAAKQGVARVEIDWQPDGTCLVRIDGQQDLCLSHKLGLLLALLITDEGLSNDGFVGWKKSDVIRKALLRETGTPVTAQNLHTLVWRLRAALLKVGLPTQLVQRHAEKGPRFALVRSEPALLADGQKPWRPATTPVSPHTEGPS